MRVIKWEPFRDIDNVFDRVFADTMRRWPRVSNEERRVYDWAPAADVSETDGRAFDVPAVTVAPVTVAVASVETFWLLTARPT